MKDMLGNKLVKGDFVAYGTRSGNTGQLRLGIITNPEKGSIVTGTGHHRTYDWNTRTDIDKWTFECSGVQGHGVDSGKLLKINVTEHINAYNQLYDKAKKYL
jgi:hypothetical protein